MAPVWPSLPGGPMGPGLPLSPGLPGIPVAPCLPGNPGSKSGKVHYDFKPDWVDINLYLVF